MKQNIEIRKLKRRDTKELSRLLRRQEGYDEFFTEEKDADILARASAERSLTFAYGEAAADDDDQACFGQLQHAVQLLLLHG